MHGGKYVALGVHSIDYYDSDNIVFEPPHKCIIII